MLYTLELHRNNTENGEYFTFIHNVVADNLFEASSELLKVYKEKFKNIDKDYSYIQYTVEKLNYTLED
jgi:hypothetical protein